MAHTAREQLKKAVHDTHTRWGAKQASNYMGNFLAGLQHLAEQHHRLRTHHRTALAEGTGFAIHLVEHRYVAFQEYDAHTIIIAGIFHESLDIPARLKGLQAMAPYEIEALKREIARTR